MSLYRGEFLFSCFKERAMFPTTFDLFLLFSGNVQCQVEYCLTEPGCISSFYEETRQWHEKSVIYKQTQCEVKWGYLQWTLCFCINVMLCNKLNPFLISIEFGRTLLLHIKPTSYRLILIRSLGILNSSIRNS